MEFQSTRSKYKVSDTKAVLMGIAPDGGLFVDPEIGAHNFDWKSCLEKDSLGIAEQILSFMLPGFPDMHKLVHDAYDGKFDTEDLTPLVKVGKNYMLELFHGPTSAFKDVALSMLPQLMQAAKKVEGDNKTTVILTATSGDTGKAAMEGFHDIPGMKIVVFYPDGGVSPVQYVQMASQKGNNVVVCGVHGNFDDCQTAVKKAFAELSHAKLVIDNNEELSSANSINIGRLLPQITYYFIAYAKLLHMGKIKLGDKVDYSVPTGNFGDILAGYCAKKLGLPIGTLICASNRNNVLTEFFRTGEYNAKREFFKTTSPSMDILVSSNLERLLYYCGKSEEEVAGYMNSLSREGRYTVTHELMRNIFKDFAAEFASEEQVKSIIRKTWNKHHYLCDPHTAVGLYAAETFEGFDGNPMVVLSTASPYKFPAAVLDAISDDLSGDEFEQIERIHELTGIPIPKNLAGLKDAVILHHDVIDKEDIVKYVESKI